jgi:hypothetical protein
MSIPTQNFTSQFNNSNTQAPQLSAEFLTTITSNTSTPTQDESLSQSDDNSSFSHSYAVLTRCWRYERGCTLLLPYPARFLDPIKEHLQHIDDMILNKEFIDELQGSLHELEIERIRYIYNDVHRMRLRKIELNPLYYAYEKLGKSKLSQAESEFAKGYAKLVMNLMKDGFNGLPGKYGSEGINFQSPATDQVVLLHYLPKEPRVQELNIPSQKRPLYPNTLIVVPYEECNEWIQNGEFDVL